MLSSPQRPPPSPRRRRLLHGFPLPPGWGRHKLLRCSKTPPPSLDHPDRSPPPDDDDAFRELRLRLLSHYDVAGKKQPPPPPSPAADCHTLVGDKPRPWNLRKRRAACGAPQTEKSPSPAPSSEKAWAVQRERRVALLQLTPEEIEEDLSRMCGGRSARKPKRRRQRAQRVMDNLNPGECVCRMLEEWYRVPEDRKRR